MYLILKFEIIHPVPRGAPANLPEIKKSLQGLVPQTLTDSELAKVSNIVAANGKLEHVNQNPGV